MAEDLFRKGIDGAVELGIEEVALTPINGDVFMDRKIIDRMLYIERSRIESHIFYTNFIGADEPIISALFAMKKCRFMEISLYGHDLKSFKKITNRGETQYKKLVDNLLILERYLPLKRNGFEIVISFRTYRSFRLDTAADNKLLDVVRRLRTNGLEVGISSNADNWGGDITINDISDIEMDLTEGRHLYRKGPCGLPFDSIQVTSTGKVNACACRDPRGTLELGDLQSEALADILSPRNSLWTKLINDQAAGRFNAACASCGFYQSIHDERRADAFGATGSISIEEFISRMEISHNRMTQSASTNNSSG
jgi:uncharacterized Fe-S cluster-containing radical SAM superfamily protein